MGDFHSFFYSVGTLLAAFLFALPPYLVSRLWNKLVPKSKINPWAFPLLTSLGLGLLIVCFPPSEEFGATDKWIVVLAFLPPSAMCLLRYVQYRRESRHSEVEIPDL